MSDARRIWRKIHARLFLTLRVLGSRLRGSARLFRLAGFVIGVFFRGRRFDLDLRVIGKSVTAGVDHLIARLNAVYNLRESGVTHVDFHGLDMRMAIRAYEQDVVRSLGGV